jgi:hypothetical protein
MSLPCERECCEHLHLHILARSSSVENLTTTHGTFFLSFTCKGAFFSFTGVGQDYQSCGRLWGVRSGILD